LTKALDSFQARVRDLTESDSKAMSLWRKESNSSKGRGADHLWNEAAHIHQKLGKAQDGVRTLTKALNRAQDEVGCKTGEKSIVKM
jgi:cytochrome c556